MSTRSRTKKAELAWPTGDRPDALEFNRPVSQEISRVISAALPADFQQRCRSFKLSALQAHEDPVGRFQLEAGDETWFIRITRRWGHPDLEYAVTSALKDAHVSVNPLVCSGLNLEWKGERLRLDLRPFIRGEHFKGSKNELLALCQTLSQTHEALKAFLRAAEIQDITQPRYQRLGQTVKKIDQHLARQDWQAFDEYAAWAKQNAEWLACLVKDYQPHMHVLSRAQVIHGEIHPGNVIFTAKGPVLLDWEESVHHYAPPEWDWAFLFQRFCLRNSPDAATLRQQWECVQLFCSSTPEDIGFWMKQQAWYSVTQVFHLRWHEGVSSPLSELEKFVMLETQAEKFKRYR